MSMSNTVYCMDASVVLSGSGPGQMCMSCIDVYAVCSYYAEAKSEESGNESESESDKVVHVAAR